MRNIDTSQSTMMRRRGPRGPTQSQSGRVYAAWHRERSRSRFTGRGRTPSLRRRFGCNRSLSPLGSLSRSKVHQSTPLTLRPRPPQPFLRLVFPCAKGSTPGTQSHDPQDQKPRRLANWTQSRESRASCPSRATEDLDSPAPISMALAVTPPGAVCVCALQRSPSNASLSKWVRVDLPAHVKLAHTDHLVGALKRF